VSTPAKKNPPAGVSASAGVTLNDWVTVDMTVTPQASGAITCDMTCNGRDVTVTFESNGEVNMDVKEPSAG